MTSGRRGGLGLTERRPAQLEASARALCSPTTHNVVHIHDHHSPLLRSIMITLPFSHCFTAKIPRLQLWRAYNPCSSRCPAFAPNRPSSPSSSLWLKHGRSFTSSFGPLRTGQVDKYAEEANSAWEAQDGYDAPIQPSNRSPKYVVEVDEEQSQSHRPKLVSGDRPKSWRPLSSSKRSHSPRAVSRRRYVPTYDRKEQESTKKEFQDLFHPANSGTQEDELASGPGEFDIDAFRDQVKVLQKRLQEAYKRGNVAQGERQFRFLLQLQQRIPSDLDELHMLCKPLWVIMMDLYIDYGDYQGLKPFLERFSMTYGQHEADRALLTLRHFFSQGLLHLAKNFWNDADKANILDERAYADVIHWMNDKGLVNEARGILNAALARSQSDPNFVLTVYFYNAAIRFSILHLNLQLLQDLLHRMKLTVPFGLGILSFVTWLHSINNIAFPHKTPKTDVDIHGKKETRSTTEKRVIQLEPLLQIQRQFFDLVLANMDSFSIRIDDALRDEIIRYDITQANTLQQMLEVISKYTSSPDVRVLDSVVDSLILHQSFSDLRKLFEDPNILGKDVKPSHTTYRLFAKWIARMLDLSTVELYSAKPQLPQSDSTDSLLHLLRTHSVPVYLFELGFLSQDAVTPSPTLVSRILQHILGHIRSMPQSERRKCHVDLQKALERILHPMYARTELGLPDDTHTPYEILRSLFDLEFYDEADQFTYYCKHRLSPDVVAGILALRMTQLERQSNWQKIDDLWQFALERGLVKRPHLLHVYVQSLLHRRPFEAQRAVAFIANVVNRYIHTSAIIHYEVLQLIYRLHPEGFDVPAFWALENVRRSLHIPIDSRTASLASMILTSYGDIFIKTEASARLHADFDAFINKSDHHHHRFSDSLDPHETSTFEDAFDRWYSIFFDAVPAANRIITPHILPQHRYNPEAVTNAIHALGSRKSL